MTRAAEIENNLESYHTEIENSIFGQKVDNEFNIGRMSGFIKALEIIGYSVHSELCILKDSEN